MKISCYASDKKFIEPVFNYWIAKYGWTIGSDFTYQRNWQDSDVVWFDFADNNCISATTEDAEGLKDKKVIVRIHALEAYYGFYHQVNWDVVDHLVFVSDKVRNLCQHNYPDTLQIHTIHNGIDLDKYTFKERKPGTNIAYVGNIVDWKGVIHFLYFFSELRRINPDYKMHYVGLDRISGRNKEFWDLMKAKIGNVFQYEEVGDVNKWLDDMDINYVVQPSASESFSMIMGEAMAKGIKSITNCWLGVEEMWPPEMTYHDFTSFKEIMDSPYESEKYRKWVADRFDFKNTTAELEKLL